MEASDWIALAACVVALASLFYKVRDKNRTLELNPILSQLEALDKRMGHLDECVDSGHQRSEEWRNEVRQEFASLMRQMTGMMVNLAKEYVAKSDFETRVKELRSEIDLAGRIDRLSGRRST